MSFPLFFVSTLNPEFSSEPMQLQILNRACFTKISELTFGCNPVRCSVLTSSAINPIWNDRWQAIMFGCFVLIIFKDSHPLWPVLLLDAAGFGPWSLGFVFAMPLQRPQLFYAHRSTGPIHEDTAYESMVSVHTTGQRTVRPGVLVFRRVAYARPTRPPQDAVSQ